MAKHDLCLEDLMPESRFGSGYKISTQTYRMGAVFATNASALLYNLHYAIDFTVTCNFDRNIASGLQSCHVSGCA